METNEESATPRFATVVRGYDRMQVDDYVERLSQWVEQADHRAQQAEATMSRAVSEAEKLRRRLAAVDAGTLTATPESVKALGDRVGQIMQSSFHATEQLRRRAEGAAQSVAAEAEERANLIIAQATERAEELSAAAESLFAQSQKELSAVEAEVARRTGEAERRVTAEREQILEQARREARQVVRKASDGERLLRKKLAALEERRHQVLGEIGLLHERLGSISDGLASADELTPDAGPGGAPAEPSPSIDPAAETAAIPVAR
jgi:cell division septum initiation protein DivIVA